LPQTLVNILAEKETIIPNNEQQFKEVEENEVDNIIIIIVDDEECFEE